MNLWQNGIISPGIIIIITVSVHVVCPLPVMNMNFMMKTHHSTYTHVYISLFFITKRMFGRVLLLVLQVSAITLHVVIVYSQASVPS